MRSQPSAAAFRSEWSSATDVSDSGDRDDILEFVSFSNNMQERWSQIAAAAAAFQQGVLDPEPVQTVLRRSS